MRKKFKKQAENSASFPTCQMRNKNPPNKPIFAKEKILKIKINSSDQ